MVKKLFKYEIIAYFKRLLPFYIILMSVAAFSRIIQSMEMDFFVFDIVYGSSLFVYGITVVACEAMIVITAITRFYKNLFTAEGYLSFTLPVTASQHIFVKLFTVLLFSAANTVLVTASFAIVTAGELGVEIYKAAVYLMEKLFEIGQGHTPFYFVEAVLFLFVSFCFNYLVYYSCITIGQLAKKNRVLAAFGVYFGYSLAGQIIGTIVTIVFETIRYTEAYKKMIEYVTQNVTLFIHIGLLGATLITFGLAVALFFINKFIITKKLNLE